MVYLRKNVFGCQQWSCLQKDSPDVGKASVSSLKHFCHYRSTCSLKMHQFTKVITGLDFSDKLFCWNQCCFFFFKKTCFYRFCKSMQDLLLFICSDKNYFVTSTFCMINNSLFQYPFKKDASNNIYICIPEAVLNFYCVCLLIYLKLNGKNFRLLYR